MPQLNSKDAGDQREASALRDEVCHTHPLISVLLINVYNVKMYWYKL